MKNPKKAPVEYLAERLEYIVWMRNRDEISEHTAGEWRDKFLEEAKQHEKDIIVSAYNAGRVRGFYGIMQDGEEYYDKNYNRPIKNVNKERTMIGSLERLKKEIQDYCTQFPKYEEEFEDIYSLANMEVELGSSPILEYYLAQSDIDDLLEFIKENKSL